MRLTVSRDTGPGGKVALPDFLANDDASRAYILAEFSREFEQRQSHTAALRQEAPGDSNL